MLLLIHSEIHSVYRCHKVPQDIRDATLVRLLHQQTVPVIRRLFAELSVQYNHYVTTSTRWVIVVSCDHHWLCPVCCTTETVQFQLCLPCAIHHASHLVSCRDVHRDDDGGNPGVSLGNPQEWVSNVARNSEPRSVKICPPPLTWPVAYTTACSTIKAMIELRTAGLLCGWIH